MFLSIKRHLDHAPGDVSAALLQFVRALLRTMRLHAVRGDFHELDRYQRTILALEQRIDSETQPADILIAAGEASRAFEDYTYQTNRYLAAHSAELTSMIGMLTSTISHVTESGQTSAAQLTRVEKRIESATRSADLNGIKAELAVCLQMVQDEADRQRKNTADTIAELRRSVNESADRMLQAGIPQPETATAALQTDPVTLLPCRADAENALIAMRHDPHAFAAVIPVDRLTLIRSRFGEKAVSRIVLFFACHLREHLQDGDQLFQWSKGSFVAIVRRSLPPDSVRADLSRFASARLEYTLEHHGREILLPVSSSWMLLPLSEGQAPGALLQKIDGFLGNEMHVRETF